MSLFAYDYCKCPVLSKTLNYTRRTNYHTSYSLFDLKLNYYSIPFLGYTSLYGTSRDANVSKFSNII